MCRRSWHRAERQRESALKGDAGEGTVISLTRLVLLDWHRAPDVAVVIPGEVMERLLGPVMPNRRFALQGVQGHERLAVRLRAPLDHLLAAFIARRHGLIANEDVDLFASGGNLIKNSQHVLYSLRFFNLVERQSPGSAQDGSPALKCSQSKVNSLPSIKGTTQNQQPVGHPREANVIW